MKNLFISMLLISSLLFFTLGNEITITNVKDSYVSNQNTSSNYGDKEYLNLKYEKCAS